MCRGVALDELGRFNETIDDFSRAIEIDETDPAAYFSRALAYHKLGKTDLAAADYRSTLQLDPAFPKAQQNLDLAMGELGANRFRKSKEGKSNSNKPLSAVDATKTREGAKVMDIFTRSEIT